MLKEQKYVNFGLKRNVDSQMKNVKMIIYANQTLRASHLSMLKLLEEMYSAERISDVKHEMSDMEEIFSLQKMYEHKKREGKIEEELKKMGYVN